MGIESDASDGRELDEKCGWFEQARFGLFVHWGLYSLLAHEKAEWVLFKSCLDRQEYNRLANQFTGVRFDADALAALARRAGMNYLVLTTRHHDGFCLFDTRTTDFNSVKTAAGRDFVGEHVEACRRAGLRVGLYHSVMSWQHDAIYAGPGADPEGWARMVEETHEQVRELMSNYGRIDMLWYDGAVVPGIQDSGMIARFWRSRELNAMVRGLQPHILINNRSGLPEDFSTPEQHFSPVAPGRRCEACMTINRSWGYNIHDRDFRSPEEIVKILVRCARFGSNLLLNIGPRADGTIQDECVERLEAVGRWLERNGEAIYGSERSPYTESEHVAGQVTGRGGKLYFHLDDSSLTQVVLDGVGRVEGAAVLGSDTPLQTESIPGDAVLVSGVVEDLFMLGHAVLAVTPTGALQHPASLLGGGNELRIEAGCAPILGEDPDRHAPPKVPVLSGLALAEILRCRHRGEPGESWTPGWRGWQVFRTEGGGSLSLDVPVSGAGVYDLDLGLICKEIAPVVCKLRGEPVDEASAPWNPGCPDTLTLRELRLPKGPARLEIESAGEFALYALRLSPVLRPLSTELWQVIGPFPTGFGPRKPVAEVRKALAVELEAQREFVPGKSYRGVGGKSLFWSGCETREGDHAEFGVNFPWRVGTDHAGVCLARTVIHCPDRRLATIMVGCDWWANVYVNGTLVKSGRNVEQFESDGAQFSTWKPAPAEIELLKGDNVVLVKCHPGSCANWFTFRISDPGDLVVKPITDSVFSY